MQIGACIAIILSIIGQPSLIQIPFIRGAVQLFIFSHSICWDRWDTMGYKETCNVLFAHYCLPYCPTDLRRWCGTFPKCTAELAAPSSGMLLPVCAVHAECSERVQASLAASSPRCLRQW